MTDNTPDRSLRGPGPVTLARAFIWSERRGQGWKLFAFPLAIGILVAASIVAAALTTPTFDPDTTQTLQAAAGQYFSHVPSGSGLILALMVVQGPSIVAMLAAILSLLMVQTGFGKRIASGEFELLLSGPYRDRDVFAAIVLGSFSLVLAGVIILEILTIGVGLALLLSSGVTLSSTGIALFAAGIVAPIPTALWVTFIIVVVYLIFPDAAINNNHPANLLVLLGIAPALLGMLAAISGIGINPFVLTLAVNIVPLAAIAVGWITIRRWFSVEKVL